MGSDQNENEKPVHKVSISSFWIGKYPITFEEYDLYCEDTGTIKPNDNGWGRGRRPVVNICWEDAHAYTKWLSEKTGNLYRLPTEAEWEYSAKGGGLSKGYVFSGGNTADNVAWYKDNSGGRTHPVGEKKANELGLFDMSGNIWEWCVDWYGLYDSIEITNPIGPNAGVYRVLRGGSMLNDVESNSVSYRSGYAPQYRGNDFGFRVVSVQLY